MLPFGAIGASAKKGGSALAAIEIPEGEANHRDSLFGSAPGFPGWHHHLWGRVQVKECRCHLLRSSSGGALSRPCWAALSILFAFLGENNRAHVPVDAARYALLVVGLAGLYLYLRRSSGFGRLGTAGFYLCIVGFASIAILDFGIIVNEGVEQIYVALGPVLGPLLTLGMLHFSAAELRAEGRGCSSPPRSPTCWACSPR